MKAYSGADSFEVLQCSYKIKLISEDVYRVHYFNKKDLYCFYTLFVFSAVSGDVFQTSNLILTQNLLVVLQQKSVHGNMTLNNFLCGSVATLSLTWDPGLVTATL